MAAAVRPHSAAGVSAASLSAAWRGSMSITAQLNKQRSGWTHAGGRCSECTQGGAACPPARLHPCPALRSLPTRGSPPSSLHTHQQGSQLAACPPPAYHRPPPLPPGPSLGRWKQHACLSRFSPAQFVAPVPSGLACTPTWLLSRQSELTRTSSSTRLLPHPWASRPSHSCVCKASPHPGHQSVPQPPIHPPLHPRLCRHLRRLLVELIDVAKASKGKEEFSLDLSPVGEDFDPEAVV